MLGRATPDSAPSPTTGPWRAPSARRPLVAALVAVVALGPVLGVVAAKLQAPADPSPATGDAQVVAHGVALLADAELAWRVARGSAPPPANAESLDGVLGFLVADQGVLLVVDAASTGQVRLPAGEAMFTPAGTRQIRAALGPSAAEYYAIELVDAAAAAQPGVDELLYSSDAFTGPGANHDLDLVRDVLAPGETVELPDGAAPTLVLATAGTLDVSTAAGGAPARLAAGEALALDGPLVLTAAEEGATYVAAVVGPPVPSLTAAGTPAAGTPTAVEPAATPEVDVTAVAPEETPTDETPTDETAPDGDGDGLADVQELELGLDPTVADSDGDGLTDGDEVLNVGTDPLTADVDGDGFLDGDEVAQGTDPFDAASSPGAVASPDDSDGDGFLDVDEVNLGTDPSDVDTDDDGLTDGDEVFVYATGPLNPDTDGDGILDGDEINNGTDPNDITSF